MLTFEKIKGYYVQGLWTKEMIHNAVVKLKITTEQYTEITGVEYK